ncbi:hypothetical protein Tco_1404902, partial [Tanacetum coccineum]
WKALDDGDDVIDKLSLDSSSEIKIWCKCSWLSNDVEYLHTYVYAKDAYMCSCNEGKLGLRRRIEMRIRRSCFGSTLLQNQSYGSNSSQPSSPTIDQFEGDLGHPQGSNASASENEMAATYDHEAILSEDGDSNIQTTEHV